MKIGRSLLFHTTYFTVCAEELYQSKVIGNKFLQHERLCVQTFSDIWAASWQNQQNDCAPSEDSDQPGYPPSQISVFAVRSMGIKNLSLLHADSKDSGQTERMQC